MVDIVERLGDYGLTLDPNVVICDRRVVDEAVSELANLRVRLGEKDKALRPFVKLADEVDYLRHEDGSTSLHRLYARDLRRAREAWGGE